MVAIVIVVILVTLKDTPRDKHHGIESYSSGIEIGIQGSSGMELQSRKVQRYGALPWEHVELEDFLYSILF